MIKMVIWDCDGTLVDASRMIDCLYQGYQKLYPNRPKRSRDEFIPCYYFTDKETRRYLEIPPEDNEPFFVACFGEDEGVMRDVKAFPYIIEVIQELAERGIRQGVNTSRDRTRFRESVKQLGEEAFQCINDIVITQEDVQHPKPNPESLFLILEKSGFIGDSYHDAKCAKDAGVPFAYAKWGEVLKQEIPCRYVLNNPRELLQIVKQ